jgi:hypothetical protein
VSHDLVKDFTLNAAEKQSHGRLDEFIQAIEHLAARRVVVTRLQKKNYADHNGELKEEPHNAPNGSREQFYYSHGLMLRRWAAPDLTCAGLCRRDFAESD